MTLYKLAGGLCLQYLGVRWRATSKPRRGIRDDVWMRCGRERHFACSVNQDALDQLCILPARLKTKTCLGSTVYNERNPVSLVTDDKSSTTTPTPSLRIPATALIIEPKPSFYQNGFELYICENRNRSISSTGHVIGSIISLFKLNVKPSFDFLRRMNSLSD